VDGAGWTIPLTAGIVDIIGKDVQGADRGWIMQGHPWPTRYVTDSVTLSEAFDSSKGAYVFCTGGGDDARKS
jgi:hypothetical protein